MSYEQFAFTTSPHRYEVKFIQRLHRSAQGNRGGQPVAHAIRFAGRTTQVVNPRLQPLKVWSALQPEVSAQPRPRPRLLNCDRLYVCSHCIPPPWYLHRSARGTIRAALGANTNFLTYSARTSTPLVRSSAFVQVTGLRPKAEMTDSSTPSRTPTGYARGPLSGVSAGISGPFGTWWQVKDSNLRSFRDGSTDQRRQACDQQYCPSSQNFRAYSPQIADDHRLQPDTSSQSAFTVWWHHDVQAGRSSPRQWDRRMPHVVHSAARSTSVD
jgi:hypothetical protein